MSDEKLKSKKASERRNSATLQQLLDAGLNAFGFELAAESMNGHRSRVVFRKPLSFVLRDVIFTASINPDRDWTHEEVLEVMEGLSRIEKMDTALVNFARAFVRATTEERHVMTHAAIILIDKYSLWKPEQPAEGD
jgi:hypothetical protein